jgi:hypothetical protein
VRRRRWLTVDTNNKVFCPQEKRRNTFYLLPKDECADFEQQHKNKGKQKATKT